MKKMRENIIGWKSKWWIGWYSQNNGFEMTDVTCTYNYFLLSKINFNRIIHSLFKKSRFVI